MYDIIIQSKIYIKLKVEHKIQSRAGGLNLSLDQVPKFLKPLVSEWAPKGFIISFKVCLIYKHKHIIILYIEIINYILLIIRMKVFFEQ